MDRRLDRKSFALSTLALTLTASAVALHAQGPLYDKVKVNLPYTVTLGDKTLEPGDYTIQQLPSAANIPVLLVYSDKGVRFETSALTIPRLDQKTPEHTDVLLQHFGADYYFDKIWIQGKDYGYEFPLPGNVKSRERERLAAVRVGAMYQQTPDETPTTTAQVAQPALEPTPAGNATPTPTPEAAIPPSAEAAATPSEPAPAPAPEIAQNDIAQNNDVQNTADREMPHTAAGWLMMLLSGSALSGAGMILRRKVG